MLFSRKVWGCHFQMGMVPENRSFFVGTFFFAHCVSFLALPLFLLFVPLRIFLCPSFFFFLLRLDVFLPLYPFFFVFRIPPFLHSLLFSKLMRFSCFFPGAGFSAQETKLETVEDKERRGLLFFRHFANHGKTSIFL